MNEFLIFFDEIKNRMSLHLELEITYSNICDYMIVIYNKISGFERRSIILREQDCDIELCFAKAHVALKEWLLENCGGY